ncbi:amidase [Paracoccaceae bacterium]|jgi:amidase|nr:amidase [Paracoccaceae bacterium]
MTTAYEKMQFALDAIERHNSRVNAVISLSDPDDLMKQAEAADQVPTEQHGLLHGEPIAIKDLANAAGFETSMGSPIFKKNHVKTDDIMVARMRASGAIIIGKTNTPEFGLGSHTFNPVHGATGNAYDATRSAGGSSGGAAVALATGMIRYADGSDMMGSLRNPAGWNNVYGMRPTWGLVPSEPLGDSFLHQLATNGPMARCPKDLATLLSVQSGPDARQPHGLPTADFAKDMDAHGLKGAQIAWLGDWGLPFDDGIMDISERAVEDLRALGADVTAIDAPFSMDALWESWITLRSWTVASGAGVFYDDPEKRDLLKPAAIWEIERGFAMSAREVHQQSVIRSMWFKKAAQLFETYDALLMPSAQVWPFPIDWVHPTEIAGVQMDTYHRWMQVVIPAGLIGLSVVNLPIGFGAAGLSAGLQLIGGRGQDAKLLGMANDWYHGTPWKDHTPA